LANKLADSSGDPLPLGDGCSRMQDSSTTLVGIDIEDDSSAMAPTICPNEQVKENTDGFFLFYRERISIAGPTDKANRINPN
jgi:hypothetical protein